MLGPFSPTLSVDLTIFINVVPFHPRRAQLAGHDSSILLCQKLQHSTCNMWSDIVLLKCDGISLCSNESNLLLFGLIFVHDQQTIFIFYYNIVLYFPSYSGSFCLVVYVYKSLYFHASFFVLLYSVV